MDLQKIDFSASIPHGWEIIKLTDAVVAGNNSIELSGIATDGGSHFQFLGSISWLGDGTLICTFIPDIDTLIDRSMVH